MCSTKSQRCVTGIGHFFWAENCGFLGQCFRNEWQYQLVSENTMVSLEKRAALSFLVSFLWEKVLFLKLAVQTLLLTHTLQKLFRDFTAWLSPCPFLLFPPVSFLQPQKYLLFCFRAPPPYSSWPRKVTLLSFLSGARSSLGAYFWARFSLCPSTLFAFPTISLLHD